MLYRNVRCFVQIVNFVGVQCEVQEEAQDLRERLRKIPVPEELMRHDNDNDDAAADEEDI